MKCDVNKRKVQKISNIEKKKLNSVLCDKFGLKLYRSTQVSAPEYTQAAAFFTVNVIMKYEPVYVVTFQVNSYSVVE